MQPDFEADKVFLAQSVGENNAAEDQPKFLMFYVVKFEANANFS